jgi:hypothetical protein
MTEVRFPARVTFFYPDPLWGSTQPPIQWVPGVKRPGYEADHSPPSGVEVKSSEAIPPLPYTPSWPGA